MPSVVNPRLKAAPAFLTKLYSMVDLSTERGIGWTPDGLAFVVPHPSNFARNLLPLWYAHSKFSSFVRQLNMYGFHKVHIRNRAVDDESATFQHEYFRRGQPYMLVFIERKKPISPKGLAGPKTTMVAAGPLNMSPYPSRLPNRTIGTAHPPLIGFEWAIPKSEPDQLSFSPPSVIWSDLPSPTQTMTELSLSSHPSPLVKPVGIIHPGNLDTYRALDVVRSSHPTPALFQRPHQIGQPGLGVGTADWLIPDNIVSYPWNGETQSAVPDTVLNPPLASSFSEHLAHSNCSSCRTSVSHIGRDSYSHTRFASPG